MLNIRYNWGVKGKVTEGNDINDLCLSVVGVFALVIFEFHFSMIKQKESGESYFLVTAANVPLSKALIPVFPTFLNVLEISNGSHWKLHHFCLFIYVYHQTSHFMMMQLQDVTEILDLRADVLCSTESVRYFSFSWLWIRATSPFLLGYAARQSRQADRLSLWTVVTWELYYHCYG